MSMHDQAVSNLVNVDSLLNRGKKLEYRFQASELGRCHGVVQADGKEVLLTLRAEHDGSRFLIELEYSGSLSLTCQRCFDHLTFEVGEKRSFVLVDDELDELEQTYQEGGFEPLLRKDRCRIDVKALIEEEILLGLPMVPRHNDGHCEPIMAKFAD